MLVRSLLLLLPMVWANNNTTETATTTTTASSNATTTTTAAASNATTTTTTAASTATGNTTTAAPSSGNTTAAPTATVPPKSTPMGEELSDIAGNVTKADEVSKTVVSTTTQKFTGLSKQPADKKRRQLASHGNTTNATAATGEGVAPCKSSTFTNALIEGVASAFAQTTGTQPDSASLRSCTDTPAAALFNTDSEVDLHFAASKKAAVDAAIALITDQDAFAKTLLKEMADEGAATAGATVKTTVPATKEMTWGTTDIEMHTFAALKCEGTKTPTTLKQKTCIQNPNKATEWMMVVGSDCPANGLGGSAMIRFFKAKDCKVGDVTATTIEIMGRCVKGTTKAYQYACPAPSSSSTSGAFGMCLSSAAVAAGAVLMM